MDLVDAFKRRFSYLRLSITPLCNFRCQYCLPHGNSKSAHAIDPLTPEEIQRLVEAFAELGIKKVRISGGEPTLRHDLSSIASRISAIPEIKTLALTTNGFRLKKEAAAYFHAGIRKLNVSIDSLDREQFKNITGQDLLEDVLSGIDRAREVGFEDLKINSVVMKGYNAHELDRFLAFVKKNAISVRFIELMPTADDPLFYKKRYFSVDSFRAELISLGWTPVNRSADAGPAEELEHSSFKGRMGFIQPYKSDFCGTCNRLRITSAGELRLCLYSTSNYSLRPLLQHSHQKEELKNRVVSLLMLKEESHYLKEGKYEGNRNFAAIGG